MKRKLIMLFSALALFGMLTGCGLSAPHPKIKEGEFAFSVTYAYGGETQTVSGVYVCEYNGRAWAMDSGYYREWNGYHKDGKTEDWIKICKTEEGDEVFLVLDLYPEYFMGEKNIDHWGAPEPYIMIQDYSEEGFSFIHGAEEVEALCGAKVISYAYDAPIENTFGLFKSR
jgi:hypothetical protein